MLGIVIAAHYFTGAKSLSNLSFSSLWRPELAITLHIWQSKSGVIPADVVSVRGAGNVGLGIALAAH